MQNLAERSCKLRDRIRQMAPTDASAFATPAEDQIVLPFPSVNETLPQDRFSLSKDKNWNYMQRKKFQELLGGVQQLIAKPYSGLWLTGTAGYGKSHLLAALVCYLVATGSRAIYIPDCRACLENPVEYIQAAMLLCWAGSPSMQAEIMALRTRGDILDFFTRQPTGDEPIIFVIDQLNELEPKSSTEEQLRNERKANLESWLMDCSSKHKRVLSASANNASYKESLQEPMNLLQVNAYGGLVKV